MRIEVPDVAAADAVADLWVNLAAGQREHGSHLLAGANRARVRDSVVAHVVAGDLFVARPDDGDELLGFVMFTVESGTYRQDVSRGVVENLFVRPDARGAGVGSELLAAAEAALRERGCDVVALEAMADNERAVAFYRRHGYEVHRVELERTVESDTHTKDDA